MTATAIGSGRSRLGRRLPGIALALVFTAIGAGGGCTCSSADPGPAGAASASASASSAPAPPPATHRDSDDRPVYPADAGPPDPLAARFCDAVQALPDRRKAACCPSSATGYAPTDQCVRTLTFALGQHAVKVDAAAVDRCAEAMQKATEGCDWVTPLALGIPPACEGILEGTLKDGDTCRSTLECSAGLRCRSLSATDLGRCGPPRATNLQCGAGIDTLATYTRQDHLDRDRPECTGYCARGRCEDAAPPGGACKSDPQCGKNRCVAGKCSAAALPAMGAACPEGACAPGAGCVKGTCAAPKAEGEGCEAGAECRGECVSAGDGGTAGTCAKRCPSFMIPTWHPDGDGGPAPRPARTVPDGLRLVPR
jgi:hypothetical protein